MSGSLRTGASLARFHGKLLQLVAWLIVVLLLAPALARAEADKNVPASLEELQQRVASVLEKHDVPAVGIAMVDRDGPVWVGSLGLADRERGIAADAETLYRIGSVSKMFVALSVLKLVEQGRMSLDDRLADLAPGVAFQNAWEATDPVRVVHLLEHTTGWDDIHLPEYAHNDPTPATLKEGLDFHPHSRVSRWVPGTRMSYCNSGPPVAAWIVQQLTGLDFEDYVQFNFFDPLGMETATYRLDENVEARGATLYSGGKPQDYWHIVMRPSGAINASPRDMAAFLRLFIDRGRVDDWQLVSEDSLARMERAESSSGARAGLEVGYGLHNYSSPHEAWVYREHNGGVNGGLTEFAYLPEAGLGHAIMINADNGAALREISRLVRAFETRELEPPTIPEGTEPGPEARELAGYYHPINPRQQLEYFVSRIFDARKLWFDGDELVHEAVLGGEPSRYLPGEGVRFRSDETGRVALVSVTDPLAGEVVHRGTTVLQPVSAVQVWFQLAVAALWGLFIASSLLFAPVWLVRWKLGRIPPGGAIRVRLWPLLASLCVVVFLAMIALGFGDPFGRLGAPTVVSVTVMLASALFGLFAVLGVVCAVGTRGSEMNRLAWRHSAAGSLLHLVVAGYLLAHGIIGLQTWA